MAFSIAQKLKIKEGTNILALHAPADFQEQLQPLPAGVSISGKTKDYTQIHWFVKTRSDMEKELDKVLELLKAGVTCWIYYPKGSSKIQTDITRDKGWDALLLHTELQWLSLISFNDTWSAFAMRLKNESELKKKEEAPKQRAIFDYIDAASKTMRLPGDLAGVFKLNKKEQAYFDTLSFTNKKEYVEWIVSAKREETRTQRIKETIERLAKKWKNPANR